MSGPFAGVGFTNADACAWLKSLSPLLADTNLVAVFPGPYVADMPDRIVTVTEVPGPGLKHEGALDDKAYQLRSRGMAGSFEDAQELANFIDQKVLGNSGAAEIGERRIVTVRRLGGAPTTVPGSPDTGRRWEFLATYMMTVNTDL